MVRKLTYVLFVGLCSFALALNALATGSAAVIPPEGDAVADPETDQASNVSGEESIDTSFEVEVDSGVPVEDLIDDPVDSELVSLDESSDFPPTEYAMPRSVDLDIGSQTPDAPPFYGTGFVSGWSPNLGDITIYLPVNYMDGYLGVDEDGYLMNISSSSITGYLNGVYNNSVNFPAFSYPRYRTANNASYTDLFLEPEDSNMEIATDFPGAMSMDEFTGYASILLLGVIVLCCMKRL